MAGLLAYQPLLSYLMPKLTFFASNFMVLRKLTMTLFKINDVAGYYVLLIGNGVKV